MQTRRPQHRRNKDKKDETKLKTNKNTTNIITIVATDPRKEKKLLELLQREQQSN
jgi:hypothetical protein